MISLYWVFCTLTILHSVFYNAASKASTLQNAPNDFFENRKLTITSCIHIIEFFSHFVQTWLKSHSRWANQRLSCFQPYIMNVTRYWDASGVSQRWWSTSFDKGCWPLLWFYKDISPYINIRFCSLNQIDLTRFVNIFRSQNGRKTINLYSAHIR